MQIIRIDDPGDPRIAGFTQVRERDLIGREGRFIAEGEVVLRHLLTSPRCEPLALLAAEDRLGRLEGLIGDHEVAAPVYAASQAVMDAIVGFPIHRGLLGLGRLRTRPSAAELLGGLGEKAVVVAVHGVGNHDNMGGLFRNAAAFGADAVLIDSTCCDPLYRKAIRVSVGAALIMPFARLETGEDLLEVLRAAKLEPVALTPSGEETLAEFRPGARSAVLFGAEGPGLPPALLSAARTVRIPMAPGFDSLNVATTSGVVLHHFAAARAGGPGSNQEDQSNDRADRQSP
ncbi:MAG: RNA methyltransferase [Phenylobacterium sp.]|uniref:TrmH family RNA methyltransferase n=1 Tax=Phenylobacterium sp. TaxID=1871053 RepID=UPI00271965EC|nr:RNA methyltransferase [Phenylobacterium sp.]MDO8408834.1 RNA methyltransferase [Phenylobacterium sp.]